ncbi:MAG TPA: class I SAM-dependent methyltransferase [Actinomycetota bacterium]|nr:class I SAM-dependent methyltransferase [Actinomycetota bacterium]
MPQERFAAQFDANRLLWDARVPVHLATYGSVGTVRRGGLSIGPPAIDEIGPVEGKDLLHLQCHFGLDTISLARLGARVTGVDLSPESIRAARELAAELGVEAAFVEANVYDVPDVVPDRFDYVFTSIGVLWWLPDLLRWAQVVASMLRPGGTFYICEIHPVASSLEVREGRFVLTHDYFGSGEPLRFETDRTYTDPDVEVEPNVEYGWEHPLSEVVNSLLQAGLRIEFLNEHPFSAYRNWPELEEDESGWRLPGAPPAPLLFSLRATAP